MKRIAVTGASGFIGSHVVEAVAARGDQAIPIARPYLRANLAETFKGVDAVVHLAGVVSAVHERDFYAANVDAARVVADATAIAGAPPGAYFQPGRGRTSAAECASSRRRSVETDYGLRTQQT